MIEFSFLNKFSNHKHLIDNLHIHLHSFNSFQCPCLQLQSFQYHVSTQMLATNYIMLYYQHQDHMHAKISKQFPIFVMLITMRLQLYSLYLIIIDHNLLVASILRFVNFSFIIHTYLLILKVLFNLNLIFHLFKLPSPSISNIAFTFLNLVKLKFNFDVKLVSQALLLIIRTSDYHF